MLPEVWNSKNSESIKTRIETLQDLRLHPLFVQQVRIVNPLK